MERSERRPPVPQIPGLAKGKIEAQRELWASRLRAGFPERRVDLLIIDKEAEDFLDLQVLGIPESRPRPNETEEQKQRRRLAYPLWMPRVELDSGAVYTTRWETPRELDPSVFVAFGGRKLAKISDLTKTPKSWDVAWLIPQRLPTIEAAMRQQDEVRHDMAVATGVEQRRVEEVLAALNGISQIFLEETEISPLRLEGLSRQAESLLRSHGFLSSRNPAWERIMEYTLRATSKDSLGRVNPLVSRILARAAYLAAIHRELRQRASWEKADRVYYYLYGIRYDTRFRMESGEMVLDSMAGFVYPRPLPALSGEVRWITPREALPIEQGIRIMARDILGPIEVAPYVFAARKAEAILVGKIAKSNREVEEFRSKLDEDGKREFRRKSAVNYLRERDAISAKKRMHQGFRVLHGSTSNPDNFEITVFD